VAFIEQEVPTELTVKNSANCRAVRSLRFFFIRTKRESARELSRQNKILDINARQTILWVSQRMA